MCHNEAPSKGTNATKIKLTGMPVGVFSVSNRRLCDTIFQTYGRLDLMNKAAKVGYPVIR